MCYIQKRPSLRQLKSKQTLLTNEDGEERGETKLPLTKTTLLQEEESLSLLERERRAGDTEELLAIREANESFVERKLK